MSGSIPFPDSVASTLADVVVRSSDGRGYGSGDLLGLLFWVAVFAIVIGAIVAIVKSQGIVIPRIIEIIFWALVSIAFLVILFRAFSFVF